MICHVADEQIDEREKKHAVVVNAPHHNPRICFTEIDINNQPQPRRIPFRPNDLVSFEGLAAGTARTDNTFRDSVPSLAFITEGGTLDFQIKNKMPDNDALAYVTFPAGDLSVYSFYPEKGIYTFPPAGGMGGAKCIARFTQFTTVTNDTTLTLKIERASGDLRYTIPSDSAVCVLNTSDEHGHHLDFHRRLTNSPTVAHVVVTHQPCTPNNRPPCPCGIEPEGADPECSNSQWP
jgi:hypothetical protein